MREVVGSFAQLKNVGSVIREEMKTQKRRRQVVSILLVKPDGKAVCLCVAKGAIRDQRLNMSPPQGGIKRGESLYKAAARELREELDVSIMGDVVYLGSIVRVLPSDHRHVAKFDDCHHHWVAAFAGTGKLRPRDSQAEASWNYLDTLESLSQVSMSKDKGIMFSAACQKFISLSGKNPHIVYPEQLGLSINQLA